MTTATRTIRSPRGTALTCKGWPQEAAMRMLMNNLDPDVAERPEDLVVYGGSGKAARNWESYDAIVRSRVPMLDDDRSPAPDIVAIAELIAANALEDACGGLVK